jgi:hypothetical protein
MALFLWSALSNESMDLSFYMLLGYDSTVF